MGPERGPGLMKEIKEKLNQAIENILDNENYYIEILNIDNVLDKVVTLFEAIYNIVPYRHIFYPNIGFYICVFPFERKSFSFRIDIYQNSVGLSKIYKSEFLEENRLTVHIKFFPHFGKEYNPIAVKFIPDDVKDLRIYIDETYFSIPLAVEITKYDLI
jgi:hypothetical protein